MPLLHASLDHLVRAPLDQVFPYLADPVNRPRWQSSLTRVELLTPGPPAVGTRWRDVLAAGLGTVDLEITDFEPNRLWAEHSEGGPLTGDIRVQFLPVGRSTGLRVTVVGEVTGGLTWFASLAARLGIHSDLRRLERRLTGG